MQKCKILPNSKEGKEKKKKKASQNQRKPLNMRLKNYVKAKRKSKQQKSQQCI
jgi:hypothetical protein